jgi:hypothetical protein
MKYLALIDEGGSKLNAMKCKHKLIKDSQGKTHPAYLSCFRKSKSNVNSQQKLKNKEILEKFK